MDTDILSEYLKGHDRTVANHAARYARQYSVFTFTSVTVYEIVYGQPPPSRQRKQGSILELPDCLIAAVAVRLQMPLVTGNTQDFRAIQRTGIKLNIENWREAP